MKIFKIPVVYAQTEMMNGSGGGTGGNTGGSLFLDIFGDNGSKIGGATVEGGVPGIITNVLKFATGFAIVVCVGILIFAGYTYMTANGDEGKIQTATKSLTWAIIGLVLCLVAVILIRFVSNKILGTDVTNLQ